MKEFTLNPKYFYQLESLRGISALLVVFFHCDYFFYPVKYIMLFKKGYLFVDLFFVLSGFVIYINYYNKLISFKKLKEFIVLRLGRIYPLHLLTTLFFLLVPIIEFITKDYGIRKAEFSISNILANIFLVQSWGFEHFFSLNGASWSISTEFFAYILFAIIVGFFSKNVVNLFFLLVLMILPILFFIDFKEDYFAALTRCVYSFSLGVLACHFFLKFDTTILKKYIPKPIFLFVLMIVFVELVFRYWDRHEYVIFPIISVFLIMSLVIFSNNWVTNKLYHPKLVKLGTLSYTIYMLHGIVITFYLRLFRAFKIDYLKLELLNIIYSIILMSIIFISLFLLSDLIHNRFEKVIRDKVRKYIKN